MRKGMAGLLTVLCCGALLASGCAKKEIVRSEESAPSAPPTATAPAEKPAPVPPADREEPVKEQPVRETPIASADDAASRQPAADASAQQEAALERIFFDFDSHVLTASARDTLAKNAEWLMKKNKSAKLQIEGHCDERGSDEYNLALGEKRAQAAQKYLQTLGVQKERLSVISYGKEKPLDPGHGEAAWAKNRRAEFLVVK